LKIKIYTDGSAVPSNPGHGGAASVILYKDRVVLIAKYLGNYVTSIASELLAIERALKYCVCNLQADTFYLYSDSKYSVMSIAGQYKTSRSNPVVRRIRKLLISPELNRKVKVHKIAAHRNPEDFSSEIEKTAIYWNAVVDHIARKAALEGDGYFFMKDMSLDNFKEEYTRVREG
jgi:ribonuclease HI